MMDLKRTNKRWVFLDPPGERVQRLTTGCRITPLLATLLANRGITSPEEATEYLSPSLSTLKDPNLLKDMDVASVRLANAIMNKETTCAYTDADADGTGAGSILRRFMNEVSDGTTISYIPCRFGLGYGFHKTVIDELAVQGVTLIYTADVGISGIEAVEYATKLGIDCLITDHHSTMPGGLPKALAVVNPQRSDCLFPFKHLCGAGVAWFLIAATRKVLRERGYFKNRPEPDIRKYLDAVTISTVGDLVPLTGENRKLVRYGLDLLNSNPSPGLAALIEVSGTKEVTSGTISFGLAPRINSANRIETAYHALNLFLADSKTEATEFAILLDRLNKERQELELKTLEFAVNVLSQVSDFETRKSIVVASTEIFSGCAGIAASKAVEMFYRPTIFISIDEEKGVAKGSCRSIKGFNILDGLHACAKHLIGYGGHKAAAGLSIAPENIAAFTNDFEFFCSQMLSDEDMIPVLEIDSKLKPTEATMTLHKEISVLEPFGMGNRMPVFAMERVQIKDQRLLKGKHLKLSLLAEGQKFDAIGFNMGESPNYEIADIAFTLDINEWQDRKNLQLMIKDIKPSGGN